MKNVCIIFLMSIIISLTAFGFTQTSENATPYVAEQYLRIHIRAESNAPQDQAVKYKVRDSIVDYLTSFIARYESSEQAVQGIKNELCNLEKIATQTLQSNGFAYSATAEIAVEEFPTRVYENYTLPAGKYTALIVRLGSGAGDNWWCVVYPPLCFTACSGKNIIYKSKIKEIIEAWKARPST